jgi:hypothetical protein
MKKFLLRAMLFTLPFYAVVMYCFVIFSFSDVAGPLGRLGEIPFGCDYGKKLATEYPTGCTTTDYHKQTSGKRHRICSIGDSFSQAGVVGYQNYMGYALDDSVLNIRFSGREPAQTAIGLLNAGFFRDNGTKVVIVEKVERDFIATLQHLIFDNTLNNTWHTGDYGSEIGMDVAVDTIAYSRVTLGRIIKWVKINAGRYNPVRHFKLNIDAFSHDWSNDLYIIEGELLFTGITPSQIAQAKKNLIEMHEMFAAQGILLMFIVAADVYDVYSDFIVDNPYPKNPTLDYFADLSSEDWFVNTKEVLVPKIRAGIKDVYKINDTHWSYLGHQIVAEEVVRRLSGKCE